MDTNFTDREVLRIMIEGGEQLCDAATKKWVNDEYKAGDEMRRDSLQRWAAIRNRIRPLAKELQAKLATERDETVE